MPHKIFSSQKGAVLPLLIIFTVIGLLVFFVSKNNFKSYTEGAEAAARSTTTSCDSTTKRPCYDKKSGNKTSLLAKGENAFSACISNSAPNNFGDFYQKTAVCDQEKVTYCHDGASANFLRKFTGDCKTTPPPPPPPTPQPSPSPTPIATSSATPFKILLPNGGENWAFGSEQTLKWEGGDTVNNWPVYVSLIDTTRNMAIREFVINTQNDGGEPWIVDLPLGTYYKIYGQGCRDGGCTSTTQWDYSNAIFNVVAGSVPVGKVNSNYETNRSLVALSPTDGEVLTNGSAKDLKWSGGTSDWNIYISLQDDTVHTTYTVLFNNLANDGVENWTIPSYIPPGSYRLYVSCTNCSAAPAGYTGGYYTYSFRPFTIKLP